MNKVILGKRRKKRSLLPLTHRSRPAHTSMVPEVDLFRISLVGRSCLITPFIIFGQNIVDVTRRLLSVRSSHFKGSQPFKRPFISKYKAEVWLNSRTPHPLVTYTSGACLASTYTSPLASHRLFFTSFPEEQHQQRRPKDEHGYVQSKLALRLLAQRHGGAYVRLLRHDGVQGSESPCGHPRRPGYAVSRQAVVSELKTS